MVVCSTIKACGKSVLNLCGYFQEQMRGHVCNTVSLTSSGSYMLKQRSSQNKYSYSLVPSISSCLSDGGFRGSQGIQCRSGAVNKWEHFPSLMVKRPVKPKELQEKLIDFWSGNQNGSLSTLVTTRNIKCNFGSWSNGTVTAGVVSGLLVCYASADSVHAEASDEKGDREDCGEPSSARFSHGKKVCTDYTVIGIPGDGRCLFRSVAHGACLRSGKPAPSEGLQKQLADELRARVADELIKRREETEWFIEGDFDNYVSQIRKPHVWGGEPELLMLF
uniref:Ubiquitin thioesterase OTU n=1 Tax=Opuntia streptacantha TaxID=393608 RepID=A0A7C9AJ38_OPUST